LFSVVSTHRSLNDRAAMLLGLPAQQRREVTCCYKAMNQRVTLLFVHGYRRGLHDPVFQAAQSVAKCRRSIHHWILSPYSVQRRGNTRIRGSAFTGRHFQRLHGLSNQLVYTVHHQPVLALVYGRYLRQRVRAASVAV
jgi:hypothetical protein